MSDDRFAFRLPKQCPNCGPEAVASIRMKQTVSGVLLRLEWQCGRCDIHWPIHPQEQGDRRQGERRVATRKRVPPKERRKS